MTDIGLVACSRQKRHVDVAPARSLYCSPLFRKASAYAERRCGRWYILSARHGVVWPNQLLEPYDEKLARPSLAEWNAKITEQLNLVLFDVDQPRLIVLAGEQYRGFLEGCEWPFEIPLEGLGIGQQLNWLTDQLTAA